MASRTWRGRFAALTLPGLLLAGCFDEPPLPGSGIFVFDDAFSPGFTPNAFHDSVFTSLSVDDTKAYSGSASIKLEVPSSSSSYSGGAVLASAPQDLSDSNALVFWATASRDATFDQLGFGLNYPPYASTYRVDLQGGLPLTTAWTRHLIPVPDPAQLTAERGMFWWAEADPTAYRVWLDDVKFDWIDPALIALQPQSGTAPRTLTAGGTTKLGGRVVYSDFDGTQRSVAAPGYFWFTTSNAAVASVDAAGTVTGVGVGQATITAHVGPVTAPGGVSVNVVATMPAAPDQAPPRPTEPASSVESLLSAAYSSHPVDTWRTNWSVATLADVTVGADPVKKYTGLDHVGIEFAGASVVDASAKAFFHVDVWSPDATAVRVKLVDYGPGGTGGGGDDSEHELAFDGSTAPDFAAGTWIRLDLPLASFAGLSSRTHLGLLVLSASPAGSATLFVDNVYFHD